MTRRTARLAWAALVATPVASAALCAAAARPPHAPDLTVPSLWLAVAASVVNVALSRLVPPRLAPRAVADPDAVALTRHLVGFALCAAAAMAPVVAFLVTRDPRLLAVAALDVLALVLLFPSEARWDRLRPPAAGAAPPSGMVS